MSDLENFFAKKDRKKLKGKKFTTTDEIAKRLEETEKKEKAYSSAPVLKKKEESEVLEESQNSNGNNVVESTVTKNESDIIACQTDDEQWNDFKEDDTIDVSDLKVVRLNIEDEEDGSKGSGDGGDDGGEGGEGGRKEGVWKVGEQRSIQSVICEAVDSNDSFDNVKAAVAAMNAAAGTKRSMAAGKEMPPRGSARRSKIAPDINSSTAFPTLADAQASVGRKKNQEERGGASEGRVPPAALPRDSGNQNVYVPPALRTNNRYASLTDHSSLRH